MTGRRIDLAAPWLVVDLRSVVVPPLTSWVAQVPLLPLAWVTTIVCPPNTLLLLLVLLLLGGAATVTVFSTGVAFCIVTKVLPDTDTDTGLSLALIRVGLVIIVGALMALVGNAAVTTLAVMHGIRPLPIVCGTGDENPVVDR